MALPLSLSDTAPSGRKVPSLSQCPCRHRKEALLACELYRGRFVIRYTNVSLTPRLLRRHYPTSRCERRLVRYDANSEDWYRSFFCTSDPPQPASSALLRCCPQMNTKLSELIALKGSMLENRERASDRLTFNLDIMVWRSNAWPTWTRFPKISSHVPDLKVDIRVFKPGVVDV